MESKNKKESRILGNLIYLFILFVTILMGYMLNSIIQKDATQAVNHYYAFAGGFGLWLAICCFMNSAPTSTYNKLTHYKAYNVISFIFTLTGIVTIFISFLISIVLIMFSSGIPVNEDIIIRTEKLFNINAFLIVYNLIVMYFFMYKYKVKEKTIVVLNNKILYKDTNYLLLPFVYNKSNIISKDFNIFLKKVDVECSDVKFKANIIVSIEFDFELAQKKGITCLDLDDFISNAKEKILEIIKERSKSMTCGELILNKDRNIKIKTCELPFTIKKKRFNTL